MSKQKAAAGRRTEEHQRMVLGLRSSGAARWDHRPRRLRTRADVKRQALRDQQG